MKNLALGILAFLCVCAFLPQSTAKKISEYPNTNALGDGDMFVTERADGATNNNITWEQLLDLINAQIPESAQIWTNVGGGDIQIVGSTNVTINTDGSASFEGIVAAVEFIGTDGTTNAFLILNPNVADAGTPYIFGTSNAHTSGHLIDVLNLETNVFWLDQLTDGVGVHIQGQDESIIELLATAGAEIIAEAPDNSYFDLFAYDASSVGLDLNGKTQLFPTAADGSTPYTLGTSIAHTSGALVAVPNASTNKLVADFLGRLTVGNTIQDQYGDNDNSALRSLNIISLGDPAQNDLFVETANNLDFDQDSWIDHNTSAGISVQSLVGLHAENSTNGSAFVVINAASTDAVNSHARIAGKFEGVGFDFDPAVADGVLPFLFATSRAHTSGGLLEIDNFNARVFALSYQGDTTIIGSGGTNLFLASDSGWTGAGTLFFADDGTFKTVGGSVNPTSGRLPYNNGGSFADSFLSQASQSIIENNSTDANSVYQFLNTSTNNSGSTITVYFSDSDGSGSAAEINFIKGTGWGLGDPNQRNGQITLSTLHTGLLNERFTIAGDAGFAFKDRDANNTLLSLDNAGALSVWDGSTLQPVTFGANDSGGSGFRLLRIPN